MPPRRAFSTPRGGSSLRERYAAPGEGSGGGFGGGAGPTGDGVSGGVRAPAGRASTSSGAHGARVAPGSARGNGIGSLAAAVPPPTQQAQQQRGPGGLPFRPPEITPRHAPSGPPPPAPAPDVASVDVEVALARARAGAVLTKYAFRSASKPHDRLFKVRASNHIAVWCRGLVKARVCMCHVVHRADLRDVRSKVSPDGRALEWGDPRPGRKLDSGLKFRDVREVLQGQKTDAFKRNAKYVRTPRLCFSLKLAARTLDLEAHSPVDYCHWVAALRELARRAQQPAPAPPAKDDTARVGAAGRGGASAALAPTSVVPGTTAGAGGGRAGGQPGGGVAGMQAQAQNPLQAQHVPLPAAAAALLDDTESEAEGGAPRAAPRAGASGGGASWGGAPVRWKANPEPPTVDSEEGHYTAVTVAPPSILQPDTRVPLQLDGRGPLPPQQHSPDIVEVRDDVDSDSGSDLDDAGTSGRNAASKAAKASVAVAPSPTSHAPLPSNRGGATTSREAMEIFSRVRHGKHREVEELLRAGTSAYVRDSQGNSLLHIACQNNSRKVAKLVLRMTDYARSPPQHHMVNLRNTTGNTALHYAFGYNYRDLGEYLLTLGADDTIRNNDGLTCYEGIDTSRRPPPVASARGGSTARATHRSGGHGTPTAAAASTARGLPGGASPAATGMAMPYGGALGGPTPPAVMGVAGMDAASATLQAVASAAAQAASATATMQMQQMQQMQMQQMQQMQQMHMQMQMQQMQMGGTPTGVGAPMGAGMPGISPMGVAGMMPGMTPPMGVPNGMPGVSPIGVMGAAQGMSPMQQMQMQQQQMAMQMQPQVVVGTQPPPSADSPAKLRRDKSRRASRTPPRPNVVGQLLGTSDDSNSEDDRTTPAFDKAQPASRKAGGSAARDRARPPPSIPKAPARRHGTWVDDTETEDVEEPPRAPSPTSDLSSRGQPPAKRHLAAAGAAAARQRPAVPPLNLGGGGAPPVAAQQPKCTSEPLPAPVAPPAPAVTPAIPSPTIPTAHAPAPSLAKPVARTGNPLASLADAPPLPGLEHDSPREREREREASASPEPPAPPVQPSAKQKFRAELQGAIAGRQTDDAAATVTLTSPAAPPVVPPTTKAPPPPPPSRSPGGGSPPPPPPPPKGALLRGGAGAGAGASGKNSDRLKQLHWSTIPQSQLENTVWGQAQAGAGADLDVGELETLFTARGTPTKSGLGSAPGHAGTPTKTALVDIKRARNVGIMLARVGMPMADVAAAIGNGDGAALSGDTLANMIGELELSPSEKTALQRFKGAVSSLSEADQFFLALLDVPRPAAKVAAMRTRAELGATADKLSSECALVCRACEQVRGSKELTRILEIILALGNILNRGTNKGAAQGFTLSSLTKLVDTKASNKSTTLLHYLAKTVQSKSRELLGFTNTLSDITPAARVSQGMLRRGIASLAKEVEAARAECAADGATFAAALAPFLAEATSRMTALKGELRAVEAAGEAVCSYFGEAATPGKAEEVLKTLHTFCVSFEKASGDNEAKAARKKERERRAAKAAKANAEAEARASGAGGASSSSRPAEKREGEKRVSFQQH